MNFADIVHVHARRNPAATALVEGRLSLDWAGLQARIEAAAWYLRSAGLKAGDLVAISLRNAVAQCIVSMAAVRSGATACLMDWRARPLEYAAVLTAIRPQILVCDRTPEESAGVGVVVHEESWSSLPAGTSPPPVWGNPTAPAFLILSSGTTGTPKAVAMSHDGMSWRSAVRIHAVGVRRGMRSVSAMPLSGSAGLTSLTCQLMAGAETRFLPAMSSTAQLIELLRRERIEHVTLVPTTVRALLDAAPADGLLLPDMQALVTAGAAFHAEEKHATLARVTAGLIDNYGSAGAGPVAFAHAADMRANPGAVGRLVLFTEVEIVDESGLPMPMGASGRIRVRSPTMALGYHGDTGRAERDEIFQDGWAYPGDLGRLGEGGLLYVEGRAASVVIRAGQNLYPEEIERVLLAHPGVAEAAVLGRPDSALGEVPVALVVARDDLDSAALVGHCRALLQSVKVPVAFHLVDSLPRTANGKIRRAALAELLPENGA